MLICDLAQAVHQNAVEHGWWEDNRDIYDIDALIHSEWSEALEEARAGRPLAYIEVFTGSQRDPENTIIERAPDGRYIARWGQEYTGKPEGIAVELIDGCIRILDFLGYVGAEITNQDGTPTEVEELWTDPDDLDFMDNLNTIGRLISFLHMATSYFIPDGPDDENDYSDIVTAMKAAFCWVKKQGIDPLALLLEKHEYNKTRPYKHGKKF